MSDLIGTIDTGIMDQQIREADTLLPPGAGTPEFLSWIKAAIEEHGFVVVQDYDNAKDMPFIVNKLQEEHKRCLEN